MINIDSLPEEISLSEAVEIAYKEQILNALDKLSMGISVLLEAEKEVLPYFIESLLKRMKREKNLSPVLVGATINTEDLSFSSVLKELEEKLSTAGEGSVIIIPHLDLLTSAESGISNVAKVLIQILASYPEATVLGCFDPSFTYHRSVFGHFPIRISILGIPRKALPKLITRREARKFSYKTFNPFALYKYISGVNAVKFRKIMKALQNLPDFDPAFPHLREEAFQKIREFTISQGFEIPQVDLDRDIGGYEEVKQKIKEEILDLIAKIEEAKSEEEAKRIEDIIPKGILFYGPPGTGKTLFSKAIANALNAAIYVVSGPEIKSKWFGESEERIRKIFLTARLNAPSVVVFDELDSVAPKRGTYQGGSGAEHSIVNQLLTELDGFRSDELVIFIGTTNFPEIIDPALLRPGRIELKIHIDYPDEKARREIVKTYNRKYSLGLSEELIDYIVELTEDYIDFIKETKYTGDHLHSLCKGIKREIIKGRKPSKEMIERLLDISRKEISEQEKEISAVHETGHAIAALFLLREKRIKKISIKSSFVFSLGVTQLENVREKYSFTRDELMKELAVLLAGRVAEKLFLKTLSAGAASDLAKATAIARTMAKMFGFTDLGPVFISEEDRISQDWLKKIDDQVQRMLLKAEKIAEETLISNREKFMKLKQKLLEKEVLKEDEIKEVLNG